MKRLALWIWLMLPLGAMAQYHVPMTEERNGNQHITVLVNGIEADFTFDTGCSSLSVSRSLFEQLMRNGSVQIGDLSEEVEAELANGAAHVVRRFIIKELQIGNYVMHDVQAQVGLDDYQHASSLLGQTVTERFASYSIANNTLYFKPRPEKEQHAMVLALQYKNDTTTAVQQRIVDALAPFADHLSPKYLILYANALDQVKKYEQAIRIYDHLLYSGSFSDYENSLLREKIGSELSLAVRLYNDSLYEDCRRTLLRIIHQAAKEPPSETEWDYTYQLLCYVYMQQEDYARAEQAVAQYADFLQQPNEELAKLYYYLSRYFANVEDYTKAQYYQTLCNQAGGYAL